MAKILQHNVIVYETYLNICRFYEIDDIIEDKNFDKIIEANSYLEIKNTKTGFIILILCSGSKYTQQNVNILIKKLKSKTQVVITNEISHSKVLLALIGKHNDSIIDVCSQHMFVFGKDHILNMNAVRKYTKDEYIKQERCGIYDDINDLNTIYLSDTQLVLYNLKIKNETLKELYTLNLKYKESLNHADLEIYKYIEPNSNMFSFLELSQGRDILNQGDFLVDYSRFNKKSTDVTIEELLTNPRDVLDNDSDDDSKLIDLKSSIQKGDGIIYDKSDLKLHADKNKINPDIYTILENVIRKHKNNMFKIGDIALFDNEFIKTPLVFIIKPPKSFDNFEKQL